jgi:hypothetical protein
MARLPASSLRALVHGQPFLAAVLCAAMIAGCSGGSSVETTVRKPASQRPDIDQSLASSGSLVIPTAQAYNLTSFKSGQNGAARGECMPSGENGADCRAEARDGGAAWGDFQLGYCFDNVAKTPLSAAVKLRLLIAESSAMSLAAPATGDATAAQQSIAAAGPAGRAPATTQSSGNRSDRGTTTTTANTVLKFFIKDSNGLIVKEQSLVSDTMDKGPHSTSDTRDLVFDARFEPERGYYLFIAGRTDVQAAPGQSVHTALSVTQCTMEIVWQAAAAPIAE